MNTMKIVCPQCKKEVDKDTGDVNRSRSIGAPVYCGRICSGLARRNNKTIEQKKEEKRLYDIGYRNGPRRQEILDLRKAYYKTEAGRASSKRNRDNRKQAHLEYIRTDKYRKWKHEYDQVHVAKKEYGELWESHLVLKQIIKEIEPEIKEVKIQKGTYNKSQKRKRAWNSLQRTLNSHFGTPYKV